MFPLHRTRVVAGIAGLGALTTVGAAGAAVLPKGITVPLPGVPAQQALEFCIQDDGEPAPTCQVIATPDITGGEIKMRWAAAQGGSVSASPVTPYPPQCGGKKGAGIRAATTDQAVDVTVELKASYAGTSTPHTTARSDRTIPLQKGISTWVCLL